MIPMGFSAKYQGKTVNGIVAIIHERLDIIEDTGAKILCFIDGKQQWLAFFFIQVIDLFQDFREHTDFTTFIADTKDRAELFIEFSY